MRRSLVAWGTSLMAVALPFALATAQEATTGTIEGTVVDAHGAPLPGVTVTITSAQGSKTETSDVNGRFRFPYLTAGKYGLQSRLQGFNTVKHQGLDVRLGSRVQVEVTMTVGVTETVEVVGTPSVVDITTTTTGATISSELMSSIPLGRSFSSTLELAPGVVASGIGEANPSIAGASGLENVYVVDGVTINNTGFGTAGSFTGAYGALGTGVSFDYVKEVQIKTGGYEPEYGEALGGYINLVTKNGGNEFAGSAFAYYQGAGLEAERKSSDAIRAAAELTSLQSTDLGFELGGPVVRDKAFFFAAFNPILTTQTLRTAPTRREELGVDHELEVDRTKYNYAGNMKWFAHPKHTFTVSAFGDPGIGPNGAQNQTALAAEDPTRLFTEIRFGGHNAVARWEGELLPNGFIEASYAYHRDLFEEEPAVKDPLGFDNRPVIDPATGDTLSTAPRVYGGAGAGQDATSTNSQYRVKFSSYLQGGGEHNLRYGFEFQDIGYDREFFLAGPSGVALPDGNVSTTGFIWDIDPAGNRFQIVTYGSAPLQETTNHYLAAFLSDSWSPVKWINLMAGVRYEQNTLLGSARKFSWDNNWAPRFHLTVDPTRDGKSKASFSYGRFFGKVPNDIAVRAMSNESIYIVAYPLSSVDLTDPNNPRITGPASGFDAFGYAGTRIDPESKLTYQDEYLVAAERELLPFLNVGVSYMHRQLGRTLEDVALVPYSHQVDSLIAAPFGEYFITNPTPALGFPKPSRKYDAVTVMAEKRFRSDDRWQLLASYTWSRLQGNYEGYFRRENGQSDPFITSLFDWPYLADPEIFKYLIEDTVLPNDRTHVFNLFGSYALRFRLNLGASVKVQRGIPLTRVGFNEVYQGPNEIPLEPRGTRGRGPTTTDLGFHADYTFKLGRQGVVLVFDIFNFLNQQKGIEFDQRYELFGTVDPHPSLNIPPCPSCLNTDFLRPTLFQEPLRIRFATRLQF